MLMMMMNLHWCYDDDLDYDGDDAILLPLMMTLVRIYCCIDDDDCDDDVMVMCGVSGVISCRPACYYYILLFVIGRMFLY